MRDPKQNEGQGWCWLVGLEMLASDQKLQALYATT